ncbi:hypothetical protein WICMUC_000649 [Wickerhamomyces mucosus]|uniref:ATP-dependent (S)-NAD(P)H-hydrate dehydratase n=1 Tax=Wickerhamomyces mucosus TaxID=1378264 RepID=A0A9P8TIC4_9ASCO|nr:hypothetical protein WICMUC_000649 [Wickerhamomyces mucosus]
MQIAGRIVVFGGCEDYTGAPYFSAHSALLFGADLSHIICEKNAATVIKSYTPNLMVHPYLYEEDNVPEKYQNRIDEFLETKVLEKVRALLGRNIHVVVVGPGLGRDEIMLRTLEKVINFLREKDIPIIIDADGLFLISQKPDLIKGYSKAILTPNVVEFKRIAKALDVEVSNEITEENQIQEAIQVSSKLGGVTVLRKGTNDLIVKNLTVLKSSITGSNRRVGGQGDSLTGVLATLIAWGKAYEQRLWNHNNDISPNDIPLLAAFGGSIITRVAAKEAFKEKGRSMQATDLHAKIGNAYKIVIEDERL